MDVTFATLYPGSEPGCKSINAPIELGIKPVCDALNAVAGVHTLWSCEGHPERAALPFVIFFATQETAYKIACQVQLTNIKSGLKYNWVVTADFRCDGSLQYKIEPSDIRIPGGRSLLSHFWARTALTKDVIRLAALLALLKS